VLSVENRLSVLGSVAYFFRFADERERDVWHHHLGRAAMKVCVGVSRSLSISLSLSLSNTHTTTYTLSLSLTHTHTHELAYFSRFADERARDVWHHHLGRAALKVERERVVVCV